MKPLLLLRTIFGISLRDLSELSNTSIGTLSEVENGKVPKPETKERIISALKVAIMDRLSEDKIFPQQSIFAKEKAVPPKFIGGRNADAD